MVPAPELAIQDILRTHWDPSATVYGQVPTINTGEYRRGDSTVPVIAITGGDEGPIGGGPESGYAAMDGSGAGGIQRVGGAVTVDCVAGTYDDLSSAGPNGEALNPKQLRRELYDHAAQLLVDHQHDTAFKTISPGDATAIEFAEEEEDNVSKTFTMQFRARYSYERRPSSP